jgi:plastocyanin
VAIGVRETEYKLTPANISPSKSGKHTILAMNQGKITHAIEVEGGGAGGKDVRSADIAPGKSATITVDLKAGKTYTWYCPIDGHKGLGMKGTITVGGSSASASAAPKTTSSSSSGGTSSGSSGGSSGGGGYGY